MPQPRSVRLEVCVDTVEGIAACQGRADRIELCAALAVGGLTPGAGLLAAVRSSTVPVHAMIRPVPGGFDYDEALVSACEADIAAARQAGCAGVVIGVTGNGALDREALARLVRAAGELEVTLHRAIDLVEDAPAAVTVAVDLGISTILTSGGAIRAVDGLPRIRAMVEAAGGRLDIMAGGGITAENAAMVIEKTGVGAVHASCSTVDRPGRAVAELGFGAHMPRRTDAGMIERLRRAISAEGRAG